MLGRRAHGSTRSGTADSDWVGTVGPGLRLRAGTVVAVLAGVGVLLLLLPGQPGHPWAGLKKISDDYAALIPLTVLVGAMALWSLRAWAAQRLLRAPGPIKVLPLEDATVAPPAPPMLGPVPGAVDPAVAAAGVLQVGVAAAVPAPAVGAAEPAPVVRLGVQLRQHLAGLRLSAPTAIPGARASTDFVDLLGTTKIDAKQPLASVGQLLRLVQPTHAYEVKATVLRRDQAPRHGIASETVVVPHRVTVLKTHWADSWEEAIELAASAIGSLIVPLSRHSLHGVWAMWRGKPLDERLFRDHQLMQQLRAANRHDEAIGHCYAALRRDPFNDHLRFSLGLLQEELALHVDALLTYHSILNVAEEQLGRAKTRAQAHAQRRIELLAAYRFTILLGFGERLAPQWTPAPAREAPVRRIQELGAVRARLRPILLDAFGALEAASPEDYELLGIEPGDRVALGRLLGDDVEERDQTLSRRRREQERRLRQARLRLLFQLFAMQQVKSFLRSWSGHRLRRYDAGLSATAVEFLPTWAELRTETARRALRRALGRDQPRAWPPTPEAIEASWQRRPRARGLALSERLRRSRSFIAHYNAACTHAIGLLDEPDADEAARARAERLAERAVKHLHDAASVSSSEDFAEQWDWITAEDPDLAGVRAHGPFRTFEAARLPSASPAPVRPANISALEASRYSSLLIRECARRFEAVWHARSEADGGHTDIHVALDWWDEELAAWDLMRDLAHNHRHWQTRLGVIRHLQAFAAANGSAPLVVAHPRYSDAPIRCAPEDVDHEAGSEAFWANRRMGALRAALGEVGDPPLAGLQAWEKALRALDGAGRHLDHRTRHALCVNRARAWERLHTAHRLPVRSEDDLERAERRLTAAATWLEQLPVPGVPLAIELPGTAAEGVDNGHLPERRRRWRLPPIEVLLVRPPGPP